MIMTSAVEARIHAVAPESIAIQFTCEQDFGFAPDRGLSHGSEKIPVCENNR
jgi:hypothetical protein